MNDDTFEVIRDNYLDLHTLLECSHVLHSTLSSAAASYEDLKKGTPKMKSEASSMLVRQLEQMKDINDRLNKMISDQILLLETEHRKTVGDLLNKPKAIVKEMRDE